VAQVVSEGKSHARDAVTLEDVLAADRWARTRALELTGAARGGAARVTGATSGRGE
jgi:hypothetical protein